MIIFYRHSHDMRNSVAEEVIYNLFLEEVIYKKFGSYYQSKTRSKAPFQIQHFKPDSRKWLWWTPWPQSSSPRSISGLIGWIVQSQICPLQNNISLPWSMIFLPYKTKCFSISERKENIFFEALGSAVCYASACPLLPWCVRGQN